MPASKNIKAYVATFWIIQLCAFYYQSKYKFQPRMYAGQTRFLWVQIVLERGYFRQPKYSSQIYSYQFHNVSSSF